MKDFGIKTRPDITFVGCRIGEIDCEAYWRAWFQTYFPKKLVSFRSFAVLNFEINLSYSDTIWSMLCYEDNQQHGTFYIFNTYPLRI